jgi:hypothetical protein
MEIPVCNLKIRISKTRKKLHGGWRVAYATGVFNYAKGNIIHTQHRAPRMCKRKLKQLKG